jgi:DNA-binding winged helix-turn-helix (wHTH) protein
VYRFDDCQVDPRQFELRRGGEVVHVEPQVFALLAHLIEHRDRVVTKTELLDAVWGGRFVSESALTSRVKMLRRAVGDDGNQQRIIATVHGVGYRFVAAVAEPRATDGSRPQQRIQYSVSPDGVRVAYASSGSGSPLVKAANWLTHLDLEWSSPIWAHWLDGLARRHRLVRYDERGCGLSDWDVADFSFDAWVNDLELVVDAAGLDRFPLLGVSQGGAVAVAYAVRHPERVSHLVLAGAYCRGRLARASTAEELEEATLDLQLGRIGWRHDDPTFRQVFASQFLPDGTRALWDAFNDVHGERGAVPRRLRADRRVRAGAARAVPDADPALPRRPAGARDAGTGAGRAHPEQRAALPEQQQPHPDRTRAGVAGVPRRDRPLPR